MTGTAIINAALTEIGAIPAGATPSTDDSTLALDKLNRLFELWSLDRRLIYVVNQNSYTFTISKQSYTIGPASSLPDFTADRPLEIERANIVLVSSTPELHIPLKVIHVAEYADFAVPALTSEFPTTLYYQPTVTKGTLWPWPYPTNASNKLELFTRNQLSEIAAADVGNQYVLPRGYAEAIILSLAESLCLPFGRPLPPQLTRDAERARAKIEGINVPPPKLDLTSGAPSSRRASYNWRMGAFK